MYGYNGKSVGYFPSFCKFYFCAKWLVYACMVTYDSIFINYTQLMGETTQCNRIFRDKSHRIQLYTYDCIAV